MVLHCDDCGTRPCNLQCLVFMLCALSVVAFSKPIRQFSFNVEWKTITRICHTKPLLTVNGQYPGPTIAVQEGDEVAIKVTNRVADNTTIHWHGIKQFRTSWADGPAYVTQCPIQTNHSYTYRFKVTEQRGTLFWHAHLSWQRASVHGAFVIYPKAPYPFPSHISEEFPILLGEWWNQDVIAIEADTLLYGGGPNVSDAYTINGLPGPLYPCSKNDTFSMLVEPGKIYLLRVINAALNDELFFAVAEHTLTVVEIDATYTKPFTTTAIMIAPGQTTAVLLSTLITPPRQVFAMAVRPYATTVFPFDKTTAIGFVQYTPTGAAVPTPASPSSLPRPPSPPPPSSMFIFEVKQLPQMRDTQFATNFSDSLRSLNSMRYPCRVPNEVDMRLFLAVSLNLQDCPANQTCKGKNGRKFSASINNQSFVVQSAPLSILEAYYRNVSGIYSTGFPKVPLYPYDFTRRHPIGTANMNSEPGTKLLLIPYGASVEVVLQDTSFVNAENHPIHFHGNNFFIVARGFGNFDSELNSESSYNLIDPPERNTVAVPSGGWAVLRFKALNPGVWFVHCHLEIHTTWGLAVGFIVENGATPSQSLLPPPADLPPC
ncbi:laccase-1 [Nymphaea colorata]|uniref:laccase-1 n=1 Tax=Nymphaea colorata TaxID=210225 RepID=UPI00214E35F0|nr:laccase-1 [Nymphaea colorata]